MNLWTLLTVLFVGLKLTGFITWSWWLVLAPTYLSIPVILLVAIFLTLVESKKGR